MTVALAVVGAAGIIGWLTIGLFHLHDRYRVGHVQGHWMALAQYANEGTLYPPLSDGIRFGGTRNMPLPIIVNAWASALTGEYLTSGKAVAVVLFTALLALVFVVLRQLRCPWPLAVALTGLLPATNTGVLVGSTMGGDVLPTMLQIATLVVLGAALRQNSQRWVMVAGAVAGVAAFSKLTAVWALLAVVSWLGLRRDWRHLGWFVAAAGVTVAFVLGIVQWASDGRFLVSFLKLTFAGTGGTVGWVRAPSQLAFFGIEEAPAVWMVAPFAIVGAFAAWRASTLTVYHYALGWSLFLTLVVFTDIGAGFNQLLDPAVLTVIAVGHFASRLPAERPGTEMLGATLAVAVIWAGATGLRGFVPDLREVVTSLRTAETLQRYNPRPLADIVTPGDTLLTDDPGVAVLLGRIPVVLDAFMLRRLDELQPETVDGLIARIEHGEFDHVALINPLEGEELWWRHYHFGPRVVGTLRETYVLVGIKDGYYLYRPRR